jgi:hypothetical protein
MACRRVTAAAISGPTAIVRRASTAGGGLRASEAVGDREQAQPEPYRFPAARAAGEASSWVQASSSLARAVISDQSWFWAKPLGEVPQPGVLGAADPGLAPAPSAVAQVEVGGLAAFGVGGEGGVEVGEPQSGAGVRALLPDDDPHPGGPAVPVQQAVMSATQEAARMCTANDHSGPGM